MNNSYNSEEMERSKAPKDTEHPEQLMIPKRWYFTATHTNVPKIKQIYIHEYSWLIRPVAKFE